MGEDRLIRPGLHPGLTRAGNQGVAGALPWEGRRIEAGPGIPCMHRRLLLLAPFLTVAAPARAETPAERASRQLRQEIQGDRAAEAGRPEGPQPVETSPAAPFWRTS